jgi:hypothetical protein
MERQGLTEKDLLALGDLFQESLEITDVDSFDPIPDGEYACEIQGVEVKKTKTTDKLMASWAFKIMEDEEGAGRWIWKNSILTDNAKNFKRFQNDLAKFDVVSDSLEAILGSLDQLKEEICLVQLKTDDKNRQWVTIDVPEED